MGCENSNAESIENDPKFSVSVRTGPNDPTYSLRINANQLCASGVSLGASHLFYDIVNDANPDVSLGQIHGFATSDNGPELVGLPTDIIQGYGSEAPNLSNDDSLTLLTVVEAGQSLVELDQSLTHADLNKLSHDVMFSKLNLYRVLSIRNKLKPNEALPQLDRYHNWLATLPKEKLAYQNAWIEYKSFGYRAV